MIHFDVQDVGQHKVEQDEAEVDDCITKHITHISKALATEGFGNTIDPSSTECYAEPTLTEEYIESSFEEKNAVEKTQSEE